MNDQRLAASLHEIHADPALAHDPDAVLRDVLSIPIEDIEPERGWLPRIGVGRFSPMFSATKYLVAGVIVALFGGLLLVGVLPNGDSDPPPAAQSEVPTQAPTRHPDATTITASGLELEVVPVSPGVYRVMSDGVRGLANNVWDVAADEDGNVFVLKQRVDHYGPPNADPGDAAIEDVRILQLAADGVSYRSDKITGVSGGPHGAAVVSMEGRKDRRFDGEAWQAIEPDDGCDSIWGGAVIAPDGACWSPTLKGYSPAGWSRTTPDGTEAAYLFAEVFSGSEELEESSPLAFAPDGKVWAIAASDDHDSATYVASFDGSVWSSVEPHRRPAGYAGSRSIAVAPDGDVWLAFGLEEGQMLAAEWDGTGWTTYGPLPSEGASTRIDFDASGRPWFGGLITVGGTESVTIPVARQSGANRPAIAGVTRASDGTVWVAVIDADPASDSRCRPNCKNAEVTDGLYVVYPDEALAAIP